MRYRLVTRSDFDGLVCATLLKHLDMIDEIVFVHPKDMQDGRVKITENDIITNLPYVPGAHLVFDHHHSETVRVGSQPNHIIDPSAPSAARVIYNEFGGAEFFTDVPVELMDAVDKADSAQYTVDEILDPTGWTLLNFLMDSRTGLGRFRDFTISNFELMMKLIHACHQLEGVEEILAMRDVRERADLFHAHAEPFIDQLRRVSTIHDDVVVVDLRGEDTIYAGNRFMVYALNPQVRVSIHALWGKDRQNTVFAVGKSIVDRTSPVDIGSIMLQYGGGGHRAAGTCQVDNDTAERVLGELITALARPRVPA
ncbi:exopolyphosphatase [Dactylosporangium matsuzakiense]|uniref:exopolyphosphatase n=1 Tax=Dactylosporangium matsuzakiense TaxID=53360 RepID=UPI0021C42C85|nr:exopolyphosphatase [Dactylosporangium matsuzakiense]UWZ40891.1 exopolyphosphatase [Dactylosporangium matsuzakiense]